MLREKIIGFFRERDMHYNYHPASEGMQFVSFESGVVGNNGKFRLRVIVGEDDDWVMALGFPEIFVPLEKIPAAVKAINYLNRERLFTVCQIDPEDGEITFRVSMPYTESTDFEIIDRMICTLCMATDSDRLVVEDAIRLYDEAVKN